MRTVAFCEIDPFCREVLRKHWPEVPCDENITKREFKEGEADIICGGFPCQDVSRAGKRAGISGSRTGLFWELVRAIRVVRPRVAIMENVATLLHDGMGVVCGALAEGGIHAEWDCIPAYAVGSPQERDRVWIVAYSDEWKQQDWCESSFRWRASGSNESAHSRTCPDTDGKWQLQPGWCFADFRGWPIYRGEGSDAWRTNWTDRLGELCRMVDGVPRQMDESRPLGNAVVPQIPEIIGRAIMKSFPRSKE
jgi:DNA (cytosine-5)-methyltransferase 1